MNKLIYHIYSLDGPNLKEFTPIVFRVKKITKKKVYIS